MGAVNDSIVQSGAYIRSMGVKRGNSFLIKKSFPLTVIVFCERRWHLKNQEATVKLQRELVFLHASYFRRFEDIVQTMKLFGQNEQQDIVWPGLIRVFQHDFGQNTGAVHQFTGIGLHRFQVHDFLLSLYPFTAPDPGDIQQQ